jgi:hypothetical protein
MLRMLRVSLIVPLALFIGACSREDFRDHNRPATYGSQCNDGSDCAPPFQCLGPSDAGPYFPICTITCTDVRDCPVWNSTGHCEGPITPVCEHGVCDYVRCD